uniref:Ubiquitin carboxyl-terminal hydrolase n=1 Tax=Knipowitschia caucasica TaxID=637954 RepID=A0AAV2KRW7_KNICA
MLIKMPVLQGGTVVATLGSPIKKNKLSLKFFHKKETKRALDFSEPQPDEPKAEESVEQEPSSCDQVFGPSPCPSSPSHVLSLEKKENLVPFIGFNNLGNTCYLNSVLQVLSHCPGLREGIKSLYSLSKKEKAKDESVNTEETEEESVPPYIDLLCSFNNLITSVEELQSSFLLNPDGFTEGDMATPPRKILNTLRQLNPMYEGYLQHDAQEVLQCILGYLHEACDTIKKEQELVQNAEPEVKQENTTAEEEAQEEQSGSSIQTRSKRKSSSEAPIEPVQVKNEAQETTDTDKTSSEQENEADKAAKPEKDSKTKKRAKLGWLRPSKKQPSIFSKFRSVGRISSTKTSGNAEGEEKPEEESTEARQEIKAQEDSPKTHGVLELMERLFQGQLVLRTRCLECESFTERREDFQDISVPVLDEQPSSPDDLSEVSPDPKPDLKTLNWAIGQFASVEHIFGEDKYFCETCHHYTEAERSLLFDKTPELITIHLKRFSANTLDVDLYAGLSKDNTPLQTPLTLCLDEWCTQRSAEHGQNYELFSVVMHSGVTISSGHYTAYVRMSDLRDVKLRRDQPPEHAKAETDDKPTEKRLKDEDEGEVFVPRAQRGSAVGKKASEGGIGLLGGQRSVAACDLKQDKAVAEGTKRRKTVGSEMGLKKAANSQEATEVQACGDKASESKALSRLSEYEGKWMLFDDSEVRTL